MQAYAEGFELFQQSEYELDNAKIAHLWNQASVDPLVAVRARRARFRGRTATTSPDLEGWVEDSGEGRWTLDDAIDHDVPMPALAAALFSRFYSRQEGDYSARVLAALRNQFGGHAVKRERRVVTRHRRRSPNPLAQGLERLPVRRRTSSSSARPATSRVASCCRRSTTWRTRARCPSAST